MHDTKIVGGIVLLALLILLGIVLLGGSSPATTTEPIKVEKGELVRDNSTKLPGESSVTFVEFGDFQCPACGAAHPVLKQLREAYQGKVTFVYRHLPLPSHPHAEIAARAAEAAGRQGKFWEMHDRLFEHQSAWSRVSNPTESFISYARDLGLDNAQFTQDIKNQALIDKIRLDKGDSEALGINATPTLVLNGEKLVGGTNYATLARLLDEALAKQ